MASFTLLIINRLEFRREAEGSEQINEHNSDGVFRYIRRNYHHNGVATANAGVGKDTGYSRWLSWPIGGTGPGINDKVTG